LDGERGLTLLEVVIALLLFAMMSTMLLSGQATSSDEVLRAEIQRDMAELLRLRLDLVALEYEAYRNGQTEGEFPAHVSTRILDEEKVLGDRYAGYTWSVEMKEVVGAGSTGRVEVEGGDALDVLFAEEGGGTEAQDEEEAGTPVQADEVDKMLFIRVTVYPPNYEESVSQEEADRVLMPHSAWTAIYLPPDDTEGNG